MSKYICTKLLTAFLIFQFSMIIATGQNNNWSVSGSLGFGYSFIPNMPSDVYNHNGENIQVGFLAERAINSKFSLISHLEIDWLNYSFDGYLQRNSSNNNISLIQAPSGVKYTEIHQMTVGENLLCRYILKTVNYKEPNMDNNRNCLKSGSIFIQAGFRLATPIYSVYYYRENNIDKSIPLGSYVNSLLLQTEVSIGAKGELKGIFSILSSSTIGIIYQFNPIFNENGAAKLSPIHISWRFFL